MTMSSESHGIVTRDRDVWIIPRFASSAILLSSNWSLLKTSPKSSTHSVKRPDVMIPKILHLKGLLPMITDRWQSALGRGSAVRSNAARLGRYVWHLLQMVLSMELGMMVYHLLLMTVLAGTGYAALVESSRMSGYWMMVLSMALPMVALMRFQKHSWRSCGAMT